jgi:hypothetical protein
LISVSFWFAGQLFRNSSDNLIFKPTGKPLSLNNLRKKPFDHHFACMKKVFMEPPNEVQSPVPTVHSPSSGSPETTSPESEANKMKRTGRSKDAVAMQEKQKDNIVEVWSVIVKTASKECFLPFVLPCEEGIVNPDADASRPLPSILELLVQFFNVPCHKDSARTLVARKL